MPLRRNFPGARWKPSDRWQCDAGPPTTIAASAGNADRVNHSTPHTARFAGNARFAGAGNVRGAFRV